MRFAILTDLHFGTMGHQSVKSLGKFFRRNKELLESVDALIISGDSAGHRQSHLYGLLKMVREFFSKPILLVKGNHDYWDFHSKSEVRYAREPKLSWENLIKQHTQWFQDLNITYLGDGPVVIGDVLVAGFDGWYHNPQPPTNDLLHMTTDYEGMATHEFMSRRAYRDLCKVLDLDTEPYRVAICVTHFPPFTTGGQDGLYNADPKFLPAIAEKFDILIYGHDHKRADEIREGCRCINAGSPVHRKEIAMGAETTFSYSYQIPVAFVLEL